jgi:ABC-type transport system involved in multi-copper enzyme maturation permease subunit
MTGAAFGWLIRDVFLRARASGFSLCLWIASLMMIVLGVTLRYDSSTNILGLLFGRWPVASAPNIDQAAREFLFVIAFGVADVLGVLITLIATSGFLPTFLDPAAATVLVSKPVSRTTLLIGRSTGIVLFVALHAGVFVTAAAIGVGISTGIWAVGFWLAWPILVLQFFAFFGFAALIAVATRSTVAAMLGGIFFWLVSWGISFGRNFLAGQHVEGASHGLGRTVDWAYLVLPKPTDFSLMMHNALGIRPDGLANLGLRTVQEQGLYNSNTAIISAVIAGVVLLALAAYEFENQDY